MKIDRVVLSCEHGGNRVPARYARCFRGADRILASHRGWDRGALGVAQRIAGRLRCPLHAATVTRLLAELNRSESRALGAFVDSLDAAEKERILETYYRPYRRRLEERIERDVRAGRRVLHLSVHSFTPVLRGEVRRADVGLLYDPARVRERELCARWRELLLALRPELRVRRNSPYRGTADGFTTALRRRFPPARYLGIELEVNQRFFERDGTARSPAVRDVEESFRRLVGELGGRGG